MLLCLNLNEQRLDEPPVFYMAKQYPAMRYVEMPGGEPEFRDV